MTELPRDLDQLGGLLEVAVERRIARRRARMAAARVAATVLAAIPIALVTAPTLLEPSGTRPSGVATTSSPAPPAPVLRAAPAAHFDEGRAPVRRGRARVASERTIGARRARGGNGEIHPLDWMPPPGARGKAAAPAPADAGRNSSGFGGRALPTRQY